MSVNKVYANPEDVKAITASQNKFTWDLYSVSIYISFLYLVIRQVNIIKVSQIYNFSHSHFLLKRELGDRENFFHSQNITRINIFL